MRFVLVISFLLLASCANQPIAQMSENSSNQNNQNNQLTNNTNVLFKSQNDNEEKIKELEIKNEQFKVVPEEFKKVDFGNFSFPVEKRVIPLKNKGFKILDRKHAGAEYFSLGDVFYADLTGDSKKEAIVKFWWVGCGASCDGGSIIVYIYSPQPTKPKLIGQIQTGAKAGGCFLKSLTVKDKKIFTEQFGKCEKDSRFEDKPDYGGCKFCVKGQTHSVYLIKNSKLIKESSDVSDTPAKNIVNYQTEVSINE